MAGSIDGNSITALVLSKEIFTKSGLRVHLAAYFFARERDAASKLRWRGPNSDFGSLDGGKRSEGPGFLSGF